VTDAPGTSTPPTEEQVPFSYRFVATDRTARELSRAFLGYLFTRPRTWLALDVVWMLCAVVLFTGMDDRFSVGARVLAAILYAVPAMVVVMVVLALAVHVRTARVARIRVHDGAVLESGFGEHTLVLRNPVESSRQDYRTIHSITARRDHVFIRRVGLTPVAVWPRALFPDDEVERIRPRLGGPQR
jgi:hypothetical protein